MDSDKDTSWKDEVGDHAVVDINPDDIKAYIKDIKMVECDLIDFWLDICNGSENGTVRAVFPRGGDIEDSEAGDDGVDEKISFGLSWRDNKEFIFKQYLEILEDMRKTKGRDFGEEGEVILDCFKVAMDHYSDDITASMISLCKADEQDADDHEYELILFAYDKEGNLYIDNCHITGSVLDNREALLETSKAFSLQSRPVEDVEKDGIDEYKLP